MFRHRPCRPENFTVPAPLRVFYEIDGFHGIHFSTFVKNKNPGTPKKPFRSLSKLVSAGDIPVGHETDGIDPDKAFGIFLVVAAGDIHGGQVLVVQGSR